MSIDFGYLALVYVGFRLLLYVFQNSGQIHGTGKERRTRVRGFFLGQGGPKPMKFHVWEWLFVMALIVANEVVGSVVVGW